MTSYGAWEVTETRGPLALSTLSAEWRTLEARGAVRTPFQSAEWLIPWWRAFGHGELRAVLVRAGGQPQALAPFLVERESVASRVTLLGLGNSDYLDVIDAIDGRADARESAITALLDHIGAQLGPGDKCDFEHLPPESMLLAARPNALCKRAEIDSGACPVLTLPHTEAELPDVVSRRFLAALRRARVGLERLGSVSIESATEGNLPTLLNELFALHQARWQMRGTDGVLSDETVRSFLRAVVEGFCARGALRLYALRVGVRTAAALCGFAWSGRMYFYASGFDPAFARYSVGSLILEHAIHEAIRQGDAELDFLSGAEPYKYRWGATDRVKRKLELRRE